MPAPHTSLRGLARCAAAALAIACWLAGLPGLRAQTSLPYVEDFESGPGGFQALGSNNPWEWGSPNNSFATEASSGDKAWYTGLSALLQNGSTGVLESPEFDFTDRVSDPNVQFFASQHLPEYAEAWMSMSLDGGPFERLGAPPDPAALNWYSQPDNESWQKDVGAANQWTLTRHPLTGAAGHRVRLRIELGSLPFSSNFPENEGFGIDDFAIYEELTEVRMLSLELPEPGTDLDQETLQLIVWNLGDQPITQVQADLTIDGPVPQFDSQTFSLNLQPTKKALITWPVPLDLSAPGSYSIGAGIQSPGDQIASNNADAEVLVHQDVVSELPFAVDFRLGTGGFTPSLGASLSSWAWEVPTSEDLGPVAMGQPAWSTNPPGEILEGENSYLQSPKLDLSDCVHDATLEFTQARELAFSESDLRVSMSVNGEPFEFIPKGLAFGDPIDPIALNWSFGTWGSNSGSPIDWQTSRHILKGTAGNQVILRFEILSQTFNSTFGEGVAIRDVTIYETPFGPGQPPVPNRAVLDINDAKDVLGYPVGFGGPGPFFAEASPQSDFELQIIGPNGTPVILYVGQLSPAILELPEVGIVDLSEFTIFGSGLLSGGLNPLFVIPTFDLELDLSVSPTLAGLQLAFQGVTLDDEFTPVLTNAVEVTFTAGE